ncbi:MAG: hypothetical protein JW963_24310 [Anaerolineales bacterium]|nr:hypothetical protein [Anaerolineales bacterium]
MYKRLFAILALISAVLACNWSDIVAPAAPEIEPSPIATFAIPTRTPQPTETPLPTLTSTPAVPIAWPKDLGVNCRYGPGKEWETVSSLLAGTTAEIKGRTVDTAWWYIQDPLHSGDFCWVAYDVVDTAGNLNIVPLVEPPAASVIEVTVDAVVAFTACGGPNEVTFRGTITTNGPATVTYRWEVSGDKREIMPDETIDFASAGVQKPIDFVYSADCGNYSVSLRVTDPTETSAEKIFKIQVP